MRATVLQIRIRKTWIALSVILTQEGRGMTIRRRLLPAMNAMRTRVRQIGIRRHVIVLNVTSMPAIPGWEQFMTTVHCRQPAMTAMRAIARQINIRKARIALSVIMTPEEVGWAFLASDSHIQ